MFVGVALFLAATACSSVRGIRDANLIRVEVARPIVAVATRSTAIAEEETRKAGGPLVTVIRMLIWLLIAKVFFQYPLRMNTPPKEVP